MKKIVSLTVWIFLITLYGCTPAFQSAVQSFHRMIIPTKEAYRKKALDHERSGELRQALMAWQVVARLDPDNPSIPEIIQTLKRSISKTVNKHHREALKLYNKGDFAAAQRELLIVLRLSPRHKTAREYLKRCLYHKEPSQYKVKRGDSYIKIATKIYNDPTKAYIIAYYNDLDPNKPLLAGKVLLLPSLDEKYMVPRVDIKAMITSAQSALDKKAYDKAISITRRIIEEVPGHQKAQRLSDQAHYQKGLSLIENQDYLAAIGELKKVRPAYQGRDAAINNARKFIQKQAVAEKLAVAQSLMQQKSYAGVINVAEEILSQNPDHGAAQYYYNAANYAMAKALIEDEKDEIAIQYLQAISQPFEDTGQLISQVRGRLHARAEAMYRKGVKHFLNEELELAIEAWQQALSLNPNHPKAAQDIENATELLDKWKGLEKNNTP